MVQCETGSGDNSEVRSGAVAIKQHKSGAHAPDAVFGVKVDLGRARRHVEVASGVDTVNLNTAAGIAKEIQIEPCVEILVQQDHALDPDTQRRQVGANSDPRERY